jgi:UDP-N-acetylmuramoyl-tripeptide--D-alanyl-D-alanine ligase
MKANYNERTIMSQFFSLPEILRITRGKLIGKASSSAIPAEKISIDSRTLRKGDVFLALKGPRFNGHDFLKDCWEKGGSGAIVSERILSPSPNFFLIQVKDTLQALEELARFHQRRLSPLVVGVTGSNGKTTIKEMVWQILSQKYPTLKSPGNFNNRIGAALTLLKLYPHHRFAVLEMGMNHAGEIAHLASMIEPSIGVIANIQRAHFGFLGGLEGIKEAKAELIDYLNTREGSWLVLNADDPWTLELERRARSRLMTFGLTEEAVVRASRIRWNESCLDFQLNYGERKQVIHLPLPGKYNLANVLAASAVALILKVPLEDIAQALSEFQPLPHHFQIQMQGGFRIVDDSYNANPDSMREALDLFKTTRGKRKIAILGDMLELGEKSFLFHREVGQHLARLGMEAVFTFGDSAREVAKEAKKRGVAHSFSFDDKDELVDELLAYLREGDCILIKGSRGMRMEEIVEKLRIRLCSPTSLHP